MFDIYRYSCGGYFLVVVVAGIKDYRLLFFKKGIKDFWVGNDVLLFDFCFWDIKVVYCFYYKVV